MPKTTSFSGKWCNYRNDYCSETLTLSQGSYVLSQLLTLATYGL